MCVKNSTLRMPGKSWRNIYVQYAIQSGVEVFLLNPIIKENWLPDLQIRPENIEEDVELVLQRHIQLLIDGHVDRDATS